MNLNKVFYLTQYIKNILTYNQYKNKLMRYFIFFFIPSLQNLVCILYTSQVRPAPFQVLGNHTWLAPVILDSALLE